MSYTYPICKCGTDLGLRFCELGDEYLCLEMQYGTTDTETVSDVCETVDSALLDSLPAMLPSGNYGRKCVHSMDAYTLANGQTVYLSSVYDGWKSETVPDVGIYFDQSWCQYSVSFTYVINWPDFGLPDVSEKVFDRYINTALGHIADSELVELGCLGAHGRTGTFLACLDIASSGYTMSARSAIHKVRREHCPNAIESLTQEWFIKAFVARHTGKRIPKKPVKVVPKITIAKSATETVTATAIGPDTEYASYSEWFEAKFGPQSKKDGSK